MRSLHVIPIAAQVLVPIALLTWHVTRTSSRSAAVVRTFVTATYLLAIMLAGLWLTIPWLAVLGYLGILAFQAPSVVRHARELPWWPRKLSGWLALAAGSIVSLGTSAVFVQAAAGHRPPSESAVDLEFPLRNGTYLVANGGSNDLVNAHVQTLTAERFHDYRGQSYGIDIVALNRFGVRAFGVAPRDPQSYVIFGQPIHAPCSGLVLRAEDGYPDMPAPQPDREHMTGNFVFMECGRVHVLLGHLARGTVRVRPGDVVAAGSVLGQVGNSGNTNEPHLHIHAQRPATTGAFPSGDALPLRLNGRFLARNDRILMR